MVVRVLPVLLIGVNFSGVKFGLIFDQLLVISLVDKFLAFLFGRGGLKQEKCMGVSKMSFLVYRGPKMSFSLGSLKKHFFQSKLIQKLCVRVKNFYMQ